MVACNHVDKPKKPDNLISKSKMTKIIVDISLLNAARGIDKNLLEKNNIKPEAYIFEKYNIDSLQFSESSNYYAYDTKAYEEIYKEAKRILEERKTAWTAEEEAKRKKQDSVRKAKQDSRTLKKDSVLKANDNPLKKELLKEKTKFPDRSRTTEKPPVKSPE